ncbi:Two-component sensor histidine kinase, contains HisKA and HATPase domains [Rhizobium sp. RU35A]|uniref:sensor histidine kinase n=1 Tax=Rhizobium sp. RU35A TaxID=1907414 RepID=UPI000955EAD8|nr:sensor histidine kinase [Rhizobium sp. RU35A]SIQ57687.1 Two-component sensor histidine kinase, contains HisKA and HATPase domains [Rhizobium sp. RU35A]
MKIRLAVMTLIALLPALAMLAYNELKLRNERQAEIHQQAIRSSQQFSMEIETILEGLRGLLIATAAIPAITDGNPAACGQTLNAVSARLDDYVGNIFVLDRNGRLLCDSLNWPTGTDFSDREYVRRALVSDDVVIAGYTIARVSNRAVLPVALRLKRNGETVGVIATGLRLDWLQARVFQRDIVAGGSVTISDRNGVIVARNPDPQSFVGTTIPQAYRHLITASAPGSLEVVSQDGTTRILGYQPVSDKNPLYVSAGIARNEAFAQLNTAALTGILFILSGCLIAFVAANYVGQRFILEPVQHIVRTVTRWRDGDLAARTGMRADRGELGLVGTSIDGLLDEIDRQRRLSAQAEEKRRLMARELSHRVKNTLSVIQAIVRQTFRGQNEQMASFQKRLQALAGGYDVLLSEDEQGASLHELIEHVMRPLHDIDGGTVRVDGPHCLLGAELAVALSLILHELGTNALKYGSLSGPEGRLSITWLTAEERLTLTWMERGGPAVQQSEREGFGSKLIRLAIPASHDPQIDADFRREGLHFTLSFRLSAPGNI